MSTGDLVTAKIRRHESAASNITDHDSTRISSRVGVVDRALTCTFECRTVPLSFVSYVSHGKAASDGGR